MLFCKNRITLIGFLGKDAETRVTAKGTAYSRFSIATNVSWKDKESGEYRTRTEWHACVAWAKLGGQPASRKAPLWKSRANSGTASFNRKASTPTSGRLRSTQARF
jgi:Single-strand binding protein family